MSLAQVSRAALSSAFSADLTSLTANAFTLAAVLADASGTVLLSAGRQRYCAPHTADRVSELSAAGATLGATWTFTRTDTSRFRRRFTDLDTGDTLAELPVPGTVRFWFDGTAWQLDSFAPKTVRQEFHVRAFGARGDGVTIDWGPITDALYAARFGGVVVFGPGDFVIDAPLEIKSTGAEYLGMTIEGNCTGRGASGGLLDTRITWGDASGVAMLELWTRDCTIRGMTFYPGLGMHVDTLVDITRPVSGQVCTNNTFENCRFADEGQSGSYDYGVKLGDETSLGAGFFGNSDYMTFDRCYWYGASVAGFYTPNTGGQQVAISFKKGGFTDMPIGIDIVSGAFSCWETSFGGIDDVCVQCAAFSRLMFLHLDVEDCAAFFRSTGVTAAPANLTILGGRFDASGPGVLAADGRYISMPSCGPLTIIGAYFYAGDGSNWSIYNGTSGADSSGVVLLGNCFPNDVTDHFVTGVGDTSQALILGNTLVGTAGVAPNKGLISGGYHSTLPIQLQGVTINGTRGVSDKLNGTNIRGTVTVTGASTTGVCTFPTAEPTADYYMPAPIKVSSTGAPAAGSHAVKSLTKAAASFTLEVEVAPGVGNSVTFDWMLIR